MAINHIHQVNITHTFVRNNTFCPKFDTLSYKQHLAMKQTSLLAEFNNDTKNFTTRILTETFTGKHPNSNGNIKLCVLFIVMHPNPFITLL